MSDLPQQETLDAYELYGWRGQGPLILTCEHASNRVPRPLRSSASDQAWLGTHWGYDIGARTVVRELTRRTSSLSICARFSRLVCDPNRPPDHLDYVRRTVEGTELGFNKTLDEAELRRRTRTYHKPYHRAVDRAIEDRRMVPGELLLCSVHSFTPIWNQRIRPMDIGILFNECEAVSRRLATLLSAEGFETALNQPYSARDGLAYAVERHGRAHGVMNVELEINQALICTPARARKVARRIARALLALRLRRYAR